LAGCHGVLTGERRRPWPCSAGADNPHFSQRSRAEHGGRRPAQLRCGPARQPPTIMAALNIGVHSRPDLPLHIRAPTASTVATRQRRPASPRTPTAGPAACASGAAGPGRQSYTHTRRVVRPAAGATAVGYLDPVPPPPSPRSFSTPATPSLQLRACAALRPLASPSLRSK
jgi:hypothetical protein